MFEELDAKRPKQGDFWVAREDLPNGAADAFYHRLDETLRAIRFAEEVQEVCCHAYSDDWASERPGIDPTVYCKMLMIGFFEKLPSERAIVRHCEDSLPLRALLGYALTESTPDHSSLSVIRTRLGDRLFLARLEIVSKGLLEFKLLMGSHLDRDSSVIEATASLRELQHRNTKEDYWSYVRKLAVEAGIDPDDTEAARRFDRKREGRRTSNEDWVNPQTKKRACDMVSKPEHFTGLETGAIFRSEVLAGAVWDGERLRGPLMKGWETFAPVCDNPRQKRVDESFTTDEGYFSLEKAWALQSEGVRKFVGYPHPSKRWEEKLCQTGRQTMRRARAASGKVLLRKRREHLERIFAHVLNQIGMRRATLRGTSNLTKRLTAAALAYNLSILMRKLVGFRTPKQWEANARLLVLLLARTLLGAMRGLAALIGACFARMSGERPNTLDIHPMLGANGGSGYFSTSC